MLIVPMLSLLGLALANAISSSTERSSNPSSRPSQAQKSRRWISAQSRSTVVGQRLEQRCAHRIAIGDERSVSRPAPPLATASEQRSPGARAFSTMSCCPMPSPIFLREDSSGDVRPRPGRKRHQDSYGTHRIACAEAVVAAAASAAAQIHFMRARPRARREESREGRGGEIRARDTCTHAHVVSPKNNSLPVFLLSEVSRNIPRTGAVFRGLLRRNFTCSLMRSLSQLFWVGSPR